MPRRPTPHAPALIAALVIAGLVHPWAAPASQTGAEPDSTPPPGPSPGWTYETLSAAQAATFRNSLEAMKSRERGPFERIRWFCADGSVLAPTPFACREHGGGRQHGEYTADAQRLHEQGLHVGPVLAALDWERFFDLANSHYFLRELVIQGFLEAAADGWVMRRARYYRGARQAEDEERAGRAFLLQLLSDPTWFRTNYLLAVQVADVIPHGGPRQAGDEIRGLALQISSDDPGFMPLRVKIHSSPSVEDLAAVAAYRDGLGPDAAEDLRSRLVRLEAALRANYSPQLEASELAELRERAVSAEFGNLLARISDIARADAPEQTRWMSAVLARGRQEALEASAAGNPQLALEILGGLRLARGRIFVAANAWADVLVDGDSSRHDLLGALGVLADAAYGAGWLSDRERGAFLRALEDLQTRAGPSRAEYLHAVLYLARVVEWGSAAANQMAALPMQRYAQVEPLAARFVEDAVRGSVLLPLAALLETLTADASREAGIAYQIGGAAVRSGVLGLNPGSAVGRFEVLTRADEIADLDPDAIYLLPETPADLGRVAGILTLDQGSRLSHVQLLARGLGIPNAAVSSAHLEALRALAGQEVLYAVSPMGSVVMLPVSEMSPERLEALRSDGGAAAARVAIDEANLNLVTRAVLPLETIDATDSGRIAGPKAANLGQLHELFPDRVAPGLVIPFGVFRAHIDRDLDGDGRTLYEETVEIYRRDAGTLETTAALESVAERIRAMPLLPEFADELRMLLRDRFELSGGRGVFVRSDTNVEDLPGFSGAGLNLTVMNVVSERGILDAVREVWASPYRQRAYAWRREVIANPEAVYPSVLILGSVPSEASGVLVTTDADHLLSGPDLAVIGGAWTVTLAAGVGGAVEGESTETVLLPVRQGAFEPLLLASARAPWRKMLAAAGGIRELPSFGDVELLTAARRADLTAVVKEIIERYPTAAGGEAAAPWDVEFGFEGDRTVLFQIRPFVAGFATAQPPELKDLDDLAMRRAGEPVNLGGTVQ
jgi:hypothetical protein